MAVQSTIRRIYWYRALDDFVLMYPYYSVFMASKGLSVFQISTLLVLWSAVDLVTNVPTGVLADKYSRKTLIGIGQLLKAASFVVWLLYPTYAGFALGFVLWGVGGALTDGAFEALVYDELKAVGQERQYVKVTGRAHTFAMIGDLAATLIAGVAIALGYNVLLAASIAVVLVSAGVIFTLPETPRVEEVADTGYFAMLGAGIREAVHNRTVLGIIMLVGFIGAIYGSLEEYVPLFIQQTGTGLTVVAWGVGATIAAAALGSFVAHRFEALASAKFIIMLGLSGAMMLAAGIVGGGAAVLLLVGYSFLIRLLQQIYDGKLQHSIGSGLRATVTSVSGFAVELLSIATYFAYGLIADRSGNFGGFAAFGGVVVVVAGLYLLVAPRILASKSLKAAAD
ncbi:MAG TPA: MFS transporter [Candidatus Saccharimonadia bacterium]|nr:MFS transporter [Candidatus Saccharimonadia bacterium]